MTLQIHSETAPKSVSNDTSHYEYAVYSYDMPHSSKKGRKWRQHGIHNNQAEAFWIAEQLKSCDRIERIEIHLQGAHPKTHISKNEIVKVIDKSQHSFLSTVKSFFMN